MNILHAIKENPGKIIFGSASSIIAIIGALFALDARYAHASDVEKTKVETKADIERMKLDTRTVIKETSLNLRKQTLEDKLFELEIKKSTSRDQKLSPMDQALYERYRRQSLEIEHALK